MTTSPLLEPLIVGHRRMTNRVLFGPIETNLATGRALSKRHTAFYEARAAGGAGAVVVEQASVHPIDHPYERCPLAAEAGPGWAAIAEACGPHGSLVLAGLSHSGGQSTSAFSQRELWAPSDEPDVDTGEVPKVMEVADIVAVIDGFAGAAARASQSGMHGVEVNAGQHSLLRQFLSGLTNRRDDAYGQDNALLVRQVLAACRSAIGPTDVLGLRLSCDELAPWAGITPDRAIELAVSLAPMIDYLIVVRGSIFSAAKTRPTAIDPPGFNLALTKLIRDAVDGSVPVFAQGSVVDVDQAASAIEAGDCDGVEMTRALLAAPNLVTTVRKGGRPRPCLLCNQGCQVRDNRNPIISCNVEPSTGREPQQTAADRIEAMSNQLLIVGAGPAGLEAARVAATNGWVVEVRERSDGPGGMAAVAASAPAQRRIADLISWLENEAETVGVTLRYGDEVSSTDAAEFDGTVIIATGSLTAPPTFDRGNDASIATPVDVFTAQRGGDEPFMGLEHGDSVVVWDPIGGPTGVAVTEFIAAEHSNVAILTPDAIVGTMLSLTGDLSGANVRLQQADIPILRRQRLTHVDANSVRTVHSFTGETAEHPCSLLVDASARYPNDALWHETGQRFERIGDAVAPRTIGDAIREGRAAAIALGQPIPAGQPTA